MDSRRNFLRGIARAAAGSAREEAEQRRRQAPQKTAERADAARPPAQGRPFPARYARQLEAASWSARAQSRIDDASALIVGAGALGSPVAAYLAGAGVGRIGVADGADVELGRLPGRHLHYTPDVGVPVAHSAAAKLGFLNPEIVIEPYQVAVARDNVAGLIAGQDLVVDCSNDASTRALLNGACCAAGTRLVSAAVAGTGGWVMAVDPGRTACLRCAERLDERQAPVALGPVAGVAGSLQAWLALTLLAGEPAGGELMALSLLPPSLDPVAIERVPDCPDCSGR